MKIIFSSPPFFGSLMGLCWLFGITGVQGQLEYIVCNNVDDCTVPFWESCETVLLKYNFVTDCCMSLAPAAVDDPNSSGCILTVKPIDNNTQAECYCEGRYENCFADDLLPGVVACMDSPLFLFQLNFTTDDSEDCPESNDYVLSHESERDIVSLELKLARDAGAEWTTEDTYEFETVTANFASAYFLTFPDLGYFDIISYLDVFDHETKVNTTDGSVTLSFIQMITWRTDLPNTTGTLLLAELYDSVQGRDGFLNALQSSSRQALASVTGTSDMKVLEYHRIN